MTLAGYAEPKCKIGRSTLIERSWNTRRNGASPKPTNGQAEAYTGLARAKLRDRRLETSLVAPAPS